jgi:glucose/arabinose dehydrogenase
MRLPIRVVRAVALTVLSCLAGSPALAQTIPAGFEDVAVVDVPAPTAMTFTPDGRMLVTSQPGRLYVIQDGLLVTTPALDLSPWMCTEIERGLLGVAVDPQFASNGYVYLFYTFKKFSSCPRNVSGTPVNRVSRFTMHGNSVDRATERVLVDNIPSYAGNHNAGDLQFGPDGYLYVATGDGGCDYTRPNGELQCGPLNGAARYEHGLVGKVLRITADGGIPATNPFRGTDSVRCNVTGGAQPGQRCQETFAWGFRNPWRLAFDPNTSGTRLFINDVGQNTWEEVNETTAGADYGWNVREGRCVRGSVTDCGTPPPGMTNPIYSYRHATGGCNAITGGAFVPTGVWPLEFEGTYLFADYTCGSIFKLTRSSTGTYSRTTFVSGLGASSAVSLRFGPFGGTQALYYLTYANGGQVRRIAAVFGTNRAPTASASASPRSGPVPLGVRFDASGSSDPDGDTLQFDWDFGDGTAHAATAIATHTYPVAGRFVATIRVSDPGGGAAVATVTIDAGNTPPAVTITSPGSAATFAVGQTLTLAGSATDAEDGALPATRLTWEVLLHHDAHTHPWLQRTVGNNLTIQAPAPEDLQAAATSYIEIRLTATDSQGAAATVNRDVRPRLVQVTFDSTPSGLTVVANGTSLTTPSTVTSWQGYALAISAPTQRDASGRSWLFASWSDGGAAAHTVVTPAAPTTYRVTFTQATAARAAADAYVRGGTYAAQNFGIATTLYVKNSSSADTMRQAFLRFPLATAPIGRAVVRMRGALSSGSSDVPIAIYPVADTTWGETAITWNSRPASGSTPIATTPVRGTAAAWYEWDVTSYVRSQVAAGRTAVSFSLFGAAVSNPYVTLTSDEAGSNRPELLTTAEPPPTGAVDIVLYAADVSASAGAWHPVADSTAAAQLRMHHPDAGAAKLAAPLANPANYFELTFTPVAGRPYRIWIRGKADRDFYGNDSVYVQFSGSITSAGAPVYRIGTTSATAYVLEDCSGCHVHGWGWNDNGYGTGVLGPAIYFSDSIPQTVRIQTREDGLSIDQVLLLSGPTMNMAPGATRDDTTIVPKP